MGILQLQQQNIAAAAAYTEYSFNVPPSATELTLSLRSGNTPLFWYMAASGSASPGTAANLPTTYNTIPAAASRTIRGRLGGQTIYFQTPGTNQVLEVDYYADN